MMMSNKDRPNPAYVNSSLKHLVDRTPSRVEQKEILTCFNRRLRLEPVDGHWSAGTQQSYFHVSSYAPVGR